MPYIIAFIVIVVLYLALIYLLATLSITVAPFLGLIAFLGGLIWGGILPIKILRGKSRVPVLLASPQGIRDGYVLRGSPRGGAKNYGWDEAWALYLPYQLRFDRTAVWNNLLIDIKSFTRTVWNKWPYFKNSINRFFSRLIWFTLLGLPVAAFAAGAFIASAPWIVMVTLVGAVAAVLQFIAAKVLAIRDARYMNKFGAVVVCPECYRENTAPVFLCPEPTCGRKHRDLTPGPLGIHSRVCECTAVLPVGREKRFESLVAECAFCGQTLPDRDHTRQVSVLSIFGSVGAGKTQFLYCLVDSLRNRAQNSANQERFVSLNSTADDMVAKSDAAALQGTGPAKTPHQESPSGASFLLENESSQVELQLMDAAGENFVTAENSVGLRYIDSSNYLIFVLDPLALESVKSELEVSKNVSKDIIAQGSGNDAYGSVIDRLRSDGLTLSDRRLAIVLSKADLVDKVMLADPIPTESDDIRLWLERNGGDRMIRRIEYDHLGATKFFAADSRFTTDVDSNRHPLRVLEWLLEGTTAQQLITATETAHQTAQ